jgi:hypothetical protein
MRVLLMFLVIIAQGLQGFQIIVEERLLHDVDATASELVGFEGLWGLYLQTLITVPLSNILPEEAGEGLFEQVRILQNAPLLPTTGHNLGRDVLGNGRIQLGGHAHHVHFVRDPPKHLRGTEIHRRLGTPL